MFAKLLLSAVFGIAMAHLEGAVVVYLRKMLGILDGESSPQALKEFPARYLFIEKTREAATIVMLVTLSLLAGNTWLERALVFLWTFAFWDLFYYISLYLMLRWPPKLSTIDILFLIPRPWIAPVWVPIGLSSMTILVILIFLLASAR